MDIPEPERVVGVIGASFSKLDGPEEEEEGDPGEVADGNVSLSGSLGGGIQGLDDVNQEGLHSYWRRILLLIGRQLVSQPKVDFFHAVVAGVVGPHGCKYLTDGAEVLLDPSLLDMLPLRRQKSDTGVIGKKMEEKNGVFNYFKAGGNLQPAAEASPLAAGSGIFLEDVGRESLGDSLLCRVVVI